MEKKLHFNYKWDTLSERLFYSVIREFLDNGCDHFVITDVFLKKMITDPDLVDFLKKICPKNQKSRTLCATF